MKKFLAISRSILWIICIIICGWYLAYFFWGENVNYEFAERCWAYTFTELLVFSTAASVYLMFILCMKSTYKWWKNLSLFWIGLLLSVIPIFVYHGYFKLQEKFYTQQYIESKVIASNKWNKSKKAEIRKSFYTPTKKIVTDTILVEEFTPYLHKIKTIHRKTLQNGHWIWVE